MSIKYTFIPYAKKGISANINEADTFAETALDTARPTFNVNIKVTAKKVDTEEKVVDTITKPISLFGPGDVIGIKPQAVIKTEPKNNTTNFAPNYLAHIEFYDEDFPWRYTPAKPENNKLRPWLALVVLKEDEFELQPEKLQNGPLPVVSIKDVKGLFPTSKEAWVWAHVHYNGDCKDAVTIDENLKKDPNMACSRLLCPRKLEAKTRYHAFLVPAFEQGRLAGLGSDDNDIQKAHIHQASWESKTSGTVAFPIYYSWYFATGLKGDFEYLVRLLEPRDELDKKIGTRKMDVQSAGKIYDTHLDSKNTDFDGTLPLEGALQLANAENTKNIDTLLDSESLEELKDLLNSNVKTKNISNLPIDPDTYDDELVLPPLYGSMHANISEIDDSNDWFNTLNLDPRFRAIAGLGVEVVRKHQEAFMERCWKQVKVIVDENATIEKDFIVYTSNRVFFDRHLRIPLENNIFTDIGPIAPKTFLPLKGNTLLEQFHKSSTPNAFTRPSFSKMTRTNSPLLKRIPNQHNKVKDFVFNGMNDGLVINIPVTTDSTRTVLGSIGRPIFGGHLPLRNFINADLNYTDNNILEIRNAFEDINPFQAKTALLSQEVTTGRASTKKEKSLSQMVIEQISPISTLKNKLSERRDIVEKEGEINGHLNKKIMAYPKLDDAMYTYLSDFGKDFLLPNINLIPPNSVALLKTNRDVLDAYMVGLNHELARELLWREYPTDQRGSYFRKFWETNKNSVPQDDYDISEIHTWTKSQELGDNDHNPKAGLPKTLNNNEPEEQERLILAIRGELLNRFPNAMIFLVEAVDNDATPRKPQNIEDARYILKPIFHAKVKPDITFLGFNITIEMAKNYFVVIAEEVPGEPRFGLDIGADVTDTDKVKNSWDNLSWKHINFGEGADSTEIMSLKLNEKFTLYNPLTNTVIDSNKKWSKNAAHMAAIFQQKPFMVAIHSDDLIPTKPKV